MTSYSIGLSGLQVAQRLIALTGENIANADTPNYHRHVADLAERVTGSQGSGVEIKRLSRVIDQVLEDAVMRNTSASGAMTSLLNGLQQLETLLQPGEGSLYDSVNLFFNEAERLTTQPGDVTQRRVVLSAAAVMTDRLNVLVTDLQRMGGTAVVEAKATVDQVNLLTGQIAEYNRQIQSQIAVGQEAIGLLELRDRAIAELGQLVDVRVLPQDFETVNVFAGSVALILKSSVATLSTSLDNQGKLIVRVPTSSQPIDLVGGKLAGLLTLHNTSLNMVNAQLNEFVRGLVTEIDHVHATGLGLDGPKTSLSSLRTIDNLALPLANAGLAFPPTAGELYVTVTNLTTGARELSRINIDPATQTLGALATAISAVPNLEAVVDPQAGTINLFASNGYGFDFSGNLSTSPDTNTITGTTAATIGGRYTGPLNDTLEFRAVGSGTIGITPGLTLEVRNGAGTLIATRSIGDDYQPGTDLAAVLGVRVRLTAGTINAGDTFEVDVAADPDSAGILTALGLNTFFAGDDAAGLRVRPDLLANPDRLAASASGQPGDGVNLIKLVALRDQPLLKQGTQTFYQFVQGIVGDVGSQVRDADLRASAYQTLGAQLEDQRQAASGVDVNEELMRLVQYQRSYQMSARFIAIVNQTLEDLLRLA